MTCRQRLLAAINHQEVDRVPCSPRIWAVLLERYGAEDYAAHLKAAADFGFDPHINIQNGLPNPFYEVGDSVAGLRDVRINVSVREEEDTEIITRDIHTPAGPLREVIRKPRPDRKEYGISPNPHRIEPLIKDESDLSRIAYLFPDPAACDVMPGYQEAEEQIGEKGLLQVTINSALDYHAGEAYPQMMIDYYDRRGLVDGVLRLFQKHTLAETRAVLEKGAKVILGSWFYSSLSVGWSPAMYNELFAPLLSEHVALVHSYGALYDMYDDGKIMGILDTVKECGVDVLETLTPPPIGDADLGEMKRRIGATVCLKGAIDLVYVIKEGNPETIERAVRAALAVGAPGSGFILGTSDSIRDGTSMENLKAYFAAARKYGALRQRTPSTMKGTVDPPG
jgi:uroporphyrinogen-III decarboxylase